MSGGIHHRRDRGFTLIELLVVVIIIGILAAIAIPVYIGSQNSATDSAVESDVSSLKKAVIVHANGGNQPYVAVAALRPDGYSGPSVAYPSPGAPSYATSGGLTATVPTDGGGFCVAAKSPTGSWFFATQTRGPTKVAGAVTLCS